MTEARWAQVKALFEAAVERPASERAEFLRAAAGGDQRLCREVESLLRADDPDAALTNLLQRQDAGPRSGSIDVSDSSSDETRTQTTSHQRAIGPYRVVSLLGAGGMGEVFRARDDKLHRDVALKLLPTAFAFDPDRLARFRREARALAALNHPHIGAIYGLEESGGRQALVLELVEGVTLAERIASGPLPVREALTLARQIAGALEAAHDKGIVHRDLKPANIKVTAAGVIKVLDFGLAKTGAAERTVAETVPSLLTADGSTRVGAVLGTAAYMSPEQARGIDVDIRTDIWAFGCVLFEMLSGRKAFGADDDSDSTEKVLAREPDWTALPARTPVKVRGLIRRCLEKDPARRLQTIAEARHMVDRVLTGSGLTRRVAIAAIAMALLAIAGACVVMLRDGRETPPVAVARDGRETPPVTVAVLPLKNETGDKSLNYYADGLTDALVSDAGALDGIRLISRDSAHRAAGSGQATTKMAESLDASAIVTGAVRRAGDHVLVDLKLTDAVTDRVMWSNQFNHPAGDILRLQAKAVSALAEALRVTIPPQTRERLQNVRAVSPAVYEEYLKGRDQWNQRTPDSIKKAIEHFLHAVDMDSSWARAHAALADCYNQQASVMVGAGTPKENRPKAADAALYALRLDSESSEAHAALGVVRHYQWKWQEAEQEFRSAIKLNPSNSLAHVWYANMLMSQKRMDEALWQVRAALKLDPYSSVINANLGWVLVYNRQPDEAIVQLRRTLEMDSTYRQTRFRLTKALLLAGRTKEAVAEAEQLVASDDSPAAHSILAVAAAHDGQEARAETLLEELLKRRRGGAYVPPSTIADVYVALGKRHLAFGFMEEAHKEGSNWVAYIASDPANDDLQDEPRFQALLQKVGLNTPRK